MNNTRGFQSLQTRCKIAEIQYVLSLISDKDERYQEESLVLIILSSRDRAEYA